jgi:tRNA (guanine-N7-)-methyltransferase
MRFKPYAGPELAACDFHVNKPMEQRGHWRELYARPQQPLHVELGCGKGGFLAQLAVQHPEINYIGIDLTDKVLILAKRNIDRLYAQAERTPDNVQILTHDIERISTMLCGAEGDAVQRIYINFCNPWNKKAGHKKHRLTHTKQLLLYREFLADDGEIWFKCDDEDLFNDTLEYLPEAGFDITWQTRDLHANEPDWNIRTEHENMFTEMGIPTKALIARKGKLPVQDT